jgi:predicted secreted protein
MPALQGELVVVTGKGLEPNRVDGVALTAQDKTAVKIENVVQEAEQIRFNLPQTLADGSYILAIKVKDSPFITKTVRVDQLPVINDVQPNPLKAAALITITGQELDAEVKVELHDTNGNAVSLSDLTQSPTSITFTAPPAGTYGLVLRLGTRNPVDRQLVVTA